MRLPLKRLLISGLVTCAVLAFVSFGIVEPQTLVGTATFHLIYSLPPTRPTVLRFYNWALPSLTPAIFRELLTSFLPTGSSSVAAPVSGQAFSTSNSHRHHGVGETPSLTRTTKPKERSSAISCGAASRRRPTKTSRFYCSSNRCGEASHSTKPNSSSHTPRLRPFMHPSTSASRHGGRTARHGPSNKTTDPLHDTGIIVHAP